MSKLKTYGLIVLVILFSGCSSPKQEVSSQPFIELTPLADDNKENRVVP